VAVDPRAGSELNAGRGAGARAAVGTAGSGWRGIGTALVQFLLPRACAACDAAMDDIDEGMLCGRCWARVPRLRHPQCARCGHPTPPRGHCPGCALLPPFVRAARSYCWVPDETSSAMVAALKYDGWPGVAVDMARRLERLTWPADVLRERAALVPVPLAPEKQRARGFNQAERLAAALAPRWGVPLRHEVLQRVRATVSQTRLTPGERLANVHGAFIATPAHAATLRGMHLILVDDVLTTGATLNACANALFAAGARTMSYVTFGRARSTHDK